MGLSNTTGESLTDVVLIETRAAANGRRIGFLTLNAPRALNALSGEMARALLDILRTWRADPAIACVVLQGAGDKAFCAGGDIVALYRNLARADQNTERLTLEYFVLEYSLDYFIHTYPKPILCWGHGIVMGGGLGLMAGASHRVVTDTSRLAMPEITIGLYPDIGASWFLNRMPGRSGLFLGLTGAHLNAADALFLKLADYFIPGPRKEAVFDELPRLGWDESPAHNRHRLSNLLRRHRDHAALAPSPVRRSLDLINEVTDRDTVEEIVTALGHLPADDPWLQRGVQTLLKGSPTSAKVIFEIHRRATHLSLKEAFAMELGLTIQFARRPDLREGIRALLIDKDNRPNWCPSRLEDVPDTYVEEHFVPPWPNDRHPFRDWMTTGVSAHTAAAPRGSTI
jgi:enoyl-CoA hydratase/carnithine racemase